MNNAAERMYQAACMIDSAVNRLAFLLGDGYGNAVSRLAYELEVYNKNHQTPIETKIIDTESNAQKCERIGHPRKFNTDVCPRCGDKGN